MINHPNTPKWLFLAGTFIVAAALKCFAGPEDGTALDTLILGDAASEQSHGLTAAHSEVIRAGLGEPARRLLPLSPVSYNGGSMSFALKVDPQQQNYVTVKLWGSDRGAESGRLVLYLDGLQVGYRHEGDYDVLNQTDGEALFQGRFVYQTVPLPLALTQGRTQVALKIAGLGPMWYYGTNFEQKQRDLTAPTRGIYRVYTHTCTRFTPEAVEKQGAVAIPGVRPAGPGEEILAQMKATVNARLSRLLEGKSGVGSDSREAEGIILLLAGAYQTPWTVAYRDPRTLAALVHAGDVFLRRGVIGKPWTGAGPLGEAITRVGAEPALLKLLDQEIEVSADLPFVPDWHPAAPGAEPVFKEAAPSEAKVRLTRREAWARVLRASLDWNRINGRRFYTNQSMIVDRNIYAANRGLRVIDPARALPEERVLRYLYEAVGLQPWLGNDTPAGGSEKPFGEDYLQITRKGLSRELGYVGSYGETILKFTRDLAELTGDEKIRQQLLRMQTARMYFRYPGQDRDGFHTMKLASEIDARTAHFPMTNGAYGICDVREAWWMELPAFTRDPVALGAVQQCLEDNQYFFRLAQRTNDTDTLGMMRNVDDYAIVQGLPKSSYRLPMTDGQPDFVFADEENAVLALKRGDQRLFVNFYFRQEFGVSGVVRILDVTPAIMRIATVKSQFEVIPSGQEWVRPDVIDFERAGGFPPPGEEIHQAWRGEKLPIAKRPAGATQPGYGKWGPFVGKAAFYWLRYGDYLIGLNTTANATYSLPMPAARGRAPDLVSGRTIDLSQEVKVGPLTTVVLYLGQ